MLLLVCVFAIIKTFGQLSFETHIFLANQNNVVLFLFENRL